MDASGKIFDKICLKAIKDTFFFQYVLYDQGTGGLSFLVGDIQHFGLQGYPPNSLHY